MKGPPPCLPSRREPFIVFRLHASFIVYIKVALLFLQFSSDLKINGHPVSIFRLRILCPCFDVLWCAYYFMPVSSPAKSSITKVWCGKQVPLRFPHIEISRNLHETCHEFALLLHSIRTPSLRTWHINALRYCASTHSKNAPPSTSKQEPRAWTPANCFHS